MNKGISTTSIVVRETIMENRETIHHPGRLMDKTKFLIPTVCVGNVA